MQIKGVLLGAALIILALALVNPAASIFMGTCEGYIFNVSGGLAVGATVNVTVDGCASQNCWASTASDSGGYYVVANLNLDKYGNVTVYANKSNQYGVNASSADQFQAAYVNVTMCSAPFPPTLTAQPDIHTTSANLSWASGADPNSLPTYDRYQLDSNTIIFNATSPQYEFGLSYASHTWRVQTCNAGCCSPWASDTFLVYNNPPSKPNLTDQLDTLNSNVTLYWISGVDPDGDPTHDEYQFQSNPIISPATSPKNETGLTYQTYTWKVRTCDNLGACSDWAIDTFSVINNPCPPPVLVPVPNGHFTNVTLNWTSNTTDIDGDPCHDRYQFDSNPIVDPATHPRNETNLTLGASYTWGVQSCDNKGACSVWQYDSFTTQNSPPSPPNLTAQPDTDASSVALQWTSGIDPDGDPTYDEYRFNYGAIITNATSPQVEALIGINVWTWQARTCDAYACSSWATDTFIRYECSCPTCPPCQGGGGGGGGGGGAGACGVLYQNVTCNESWVCEDWSPCFEIHPKYNKIWGHKKQGVQVRECADTSTCKTNCTRPDTWQFCEPEKGPIPSLTLPVMFAIPIWVVILILILIGLIIYLIYRDRKLKKELKELKEGQNEYSKYKKSPYFEKWVKGLYKRAK